MDDELMRDGSRSASEFPPAAEAEFDGSDGDSRTDAHPDYASMRRWPRFPVDFTVRVRVTTQGPTRVAAWEGQGTDISGGGLAVTIDSNLPVGAQVAVEFTPPNSDRMLTFRCFVRNRKGNCHGVEFITENDEDYRNAGELHAMLAKINAKRTS
jgi:hypothetical protein